jgi:hypothetical protein
VNIALTILHKMLHQASRDAGARGTKNSPRPDFTLESSESRIQSTPCSYHFRVER